MELKTKLKNEIFNIMSAPVYVDGYEIKKRTDVPAWILNNIDEMVEEAEQLIDRAISNGKIDSINEKVIYAAAYRVIDDCY